MVFFGDYEGVFLEKKGLKKEVKDLQRFENLEGLKGPKIHSPWLQPREKDHD